MRPNVSNFPRLDRATVWLRDKQRVNFAHTDSSLSKFDALRRTSVFPPSSLELL